MSRVDRPASKQSVSAAVAFGRAPAKTIAAQRAGQQRNTQEVVFARAPAAQHDAQPRSTRSTTKTAACMSRQATHPASRTWNASLRSGEMMRFRRRRLYSLSRSTMRRPCSRPPSSCSSPGDGRRPGVWEATPGGGGRRSAATTPPGQRSRSMRCEPPYAQGLLQQAGIKHVNRCTGSFRAEQRQSSKSRQQVAAGGENSRTRKDAHRRPPASAGPPSPTWVLCRTPACCSRSERGTARVSCSLLWQVATAASRGTATAAAAAAARSVCRLLGARPRPAR